MSLTIINSKVFLKANKNILIIRRFIIVLLVIIILSNNSIGQTIHEIHINFGSFGNSFIRKKMLDGDASYTISNSFEYGFSYFCNLTKKIAFESGINHLKCTVEITPAFLGLDEIPYYQELTLWSLPVYGYYFFNKNFNTHGGLIFDYQNEELTFDSQLGVAVGLGLGGKFQYKRCIFFMNPNLKIHSLIPFKVEKYHQSLFQAGLEFGLGYSF